MKDRKKECGVGRGRGVISVGWGFINFCLVFIFGVKSVVLWVF